MKRVLVELKDLSKKFGKEYVIKDLNLDIYEGEFLTLLGPSGCGKTTILRMISGLEKVTSGKVIIDGKDVTDIVPAKREVNTIFQNFALFPHMTVWDNIDFGLKMHKVPRSEADKRIKDAINLVKLDGFENRKPDELSGGQQQRVAIARGIVLKHKVLLLDESLASLDLKLKREMQIELKKIQKSLGITFIYVTHDQDEALTMSDRIAIINNGTVEQIDTPENIYRKPNTTFVADFIGEANILTGKVIKTNDTEATISLPDNIEVTIDNKGYNIGEEKTVVIRPECFEISPIESLDSFKGVIKEYIYDGMITKLIIQKDNTELRINLMDASSFKEGDDIYMKVPKKYIIVLGDKNE